MTPYRCTLLELVQKYATSPERISILKGYCDFRTALISNGITGFQWADGSFVENVESQRGRPPGDIDVVTFGHLDSAAWIAIVPVELRDHDLVKADYLVDHFIVPLHCNPEVLVEMTRYWFGLFSHRRDDFLWKGMLAVALPCITETATATFIGAL